MFREPLFHFLAFSLLIFAFFEAFPNAQDGEEGLREIVVDQQEIQRLSDTWTQSWGRPPTSEQLSNLLDNSVKEEIYYREGLRLGLDKNDTVVRNRMVQKMRFLHSEQLPEPTEADLQAYLTTNIDNYRQGASYSFEQIYLGQEFKLDKVPDLIEKLNNEQVEPSDLSYTLSVPNSFFEASQDQVSRQLGQEFAATLSSETNARLEWFGPILSGFGLHLVRIEDVKEGQTPTLENSIVRKRVQNDWSAHHRQAIEERIFAEIKQDYTVRIL